MPEFETPSAYPNQPAGQPPPDIAVLLIERLVRNEVDARVEKEQQLLKKSAEIALKIMAVAAALLVAILTVFGLTTWSDIKEEAALVVKEQTEELLQKADSETNVKEALNDLLNRTVVSSHLARKALLPRENIVLASSDWDRLRSWVKKEDLPLQDFKDTLSVLNSQPDDRKRIDANSLLAELLNPPARSPYAWLRKQPDKTASILANFKDKNLGSAAVQLVASNAFTDSLRGNAAAYVQEVGFSAGVEALLAAYAKLSWGDAKRKALLACVALRPDLAKVVAEVKRLLLCEDPDKEQIATMADIIQWMSRFGAFADRELSKDILLYATKSGLEFSLTVDENLALDPSDPPPTYVSLQLSRPKWPVESLKRIAISDFRDFHDYWKLLAEQANAGHIDRLVRLLPRFEAGWGADRAIDAALEISADPGAKAILDQGGVNTEVDLMSLKGATVRATGVEEKSAIITFHGNAGERTDATLVGLRGTGYRFLLRQPRRNHRAGAATARKEKRRWKDV